MIPPLRLIALPLLLIAGTAAAADLYQIELVVFARDSAEAEVEERWDRDYGLRYPERLVGLQAEDAPSPEASPPAAPAPGPAPVSPFQLLSKAALRLAGEANAINRRSNLRVLFHGAWVQPGGSVGSDDPVLITGGRSFGDHHELEGFVTLTVDRYLRLDANLWMSRFAVANGVQPVDAPVLPKPVVTTGSGAITTEEPAAQQPALIPVDPYIPVQIYVMDQERRMRNGETHYLDHPRFGVLVRVAPYQAPQLPAAVVTEPAPTARP